MSIGRKKNKTQGTLLGWRYWRVFQSDGRFYLKSPFTLSNWESYIYKIRNIKNESGLYAYHDLHNLLYSDFENQNELVCGLVSAKGKTEIYEGGFKTREA